MLTPDLSPAPESDLRQTGLSSCPDLHATVAANLTFEYLGSYQWPDLAAIYMGTDLRRHRPLRSGRQFRLLLPNRLT
jgi:hypothetical protein